MNKFRHFSDSPPMTERWRNLLDESRLARNQPWFGNPQANRLKQNYLRRANLQDPNEFLAEPDTGVGEFFPLIEREEPLPKSEKQTALENFKQELKDNQRYLYQGVPRKSYFEGEKGINQKGWRKRFDPEIMGATGSLKDKINDDPFTLTNHYFAEGTPSGKKIAANYAFTENEKGRSPGNLTRTILDKDQRKRLYPDPKQEKAWMYEQYPGMYRPSDEKSLKDKWNNVFQNTKKPAQIEKIFSESSKNPKYLEFLPDRHPKYLDYSIPPNQILYPGKKQESEFLYNFLSKEDGFPDGVSEEELMDVLENSFEGDQDLINKAKKPVFAEKMRSFQSEDNLPKIIRKNLAISQGLAGNEEIKRGQHLEDERIEQLLKGR